MHHESRNEGRPANTPPDRSKHDEAWWPPIVLLVIIALSYLSGHGLDRIDWPRIWRQFTSLWAQVLALAGVGVSAFALYRLRSARPKIYASLEGLVALTSGWMAFSSATATERGLKLAAAVYLMVRAIDNWNRERPAVSSANVKGELVVEQ